LKRATSRSPDKSSPLMQPRDRFTEKDSLYLDVGKPDITGRIDTLNNNSMQNSILFASRVSDINSANSSASNSPYKKSAYGDLKVEHKSFKAATANITNQQLLKSGLYKNMGNDEEYKGEESPILRLERLQNEKKNRSSEQSGRTGSQSPTIERPSEGVDVSPFQLKVEQVQPNAINSAGAQVNSAGAGNKSQLSGRRYQPFPQKN